MSGKLKRILAAILSIALVVGNVPLSVLPVKATDESVIELNFAHPTTGVISDRAEDMGENATIGIDPTVKYSALRLFTITSSFQGSNWRINTSRTVPALAEGETSYPADNTGFIIRKMSSEATKQDGSYGTYRSAFYIYGNKTFAADFDVTSAQAGYYTVELEYYDKSDPRPLDIKVNAETANAFTTQFTAAGATNGGEMAIEELAGTVALVEGTNTIDIISTQTKDGNETIIRAVIFTKIGDLQTPAPTATPEPTAAPTEEPTLAPTATPSVDEGAVELDFGNPTLGVISNNADEMGENETIGIDPTKAPASGGLTVYTLTSSFQGSNWQINTSRTVPALADGETSYPADNTGFVIRKWNVKNNLDKTYRSVLYLYGNKTLAADFSVTAAQAGYYTMEIEYYDSSDPRALSIKVNADTDNAFTTQFTASTSTNAKAMVIEQLEGIVTLVEGTNTIDIISTQTKDANETIIRAVRFIPYVGPAPTPAPTATPAPTPAPTATPAPTEDPNAVKEPFSVSINTVDVNTLYVDGSSYYLTANTVGSNWAVHEDTDSRNLTDGTSLTNVVRLFTENGVINQAILYRQKVNLVFAFTAPASGYYDISCDVNWRSTGGYADIFINDTYVGTLDSNKGSGTTVQKLLGTYLKPGELANTLTIKGTGISTGTYHYFAWNEFDFTTPSTIASITGAEIPLDETEDVFVGDVKSAAANGTMTNGGLYRFASAGVSVTYTSSNKAVATISSKGVLTAVGAGTTTITATVPSLGFTDSIEITVKEVVYDTPEINLEDNREFMEGDTFELETKAKFNSGNYADATEVTTVYESSDETVVKVVEGVLQAVGVGTVTITAHVTYEGKTLDVSRNVIVTEYRPPVAFEVKIKGFKDAFETDSSIYMTADTYGKNWKVSAKTDAPLATATSNGTCRIFEGTYMTYLNLMRKGKTFTFDVEVQDPGEYDITANMLQNTKGGYATIHVNDVYVGTVDTYAQSTDSMYTKKQPLLGVKLHKGTNTISVKPVATSGGTSAYTMFTGFSFSTPENIATITEIDATADVDSMYIGREEQIQIDAILSNGGFYQFEYSTEKFTYESSDTTVAKVSDTGVITGMGKGTATITVTAVDGGWSDTITFAVTDAAFDKVEMNVAEGENIYIASEKTLEVVATLTDGTVVSQNDLKIEYSSDNEAAAVVEDGVLKGLAKGNATITATVTFTVDGTIKTDVKHIAVTTIPIKGVTGATVKPVVQELDKDGVQFVAKCVAEDDTIIEDFAAAGFASVEFKYTSLTPELLTIDENGICHYVSRGDAQVKIEALIDGVPFEAVVDVVSSSSKTGRTLYTDQMIANAHENTTTDPIGKKRLASLGGRAFQYVYSLDMIYDLIPSEGVPRSRYNSTRLADDKVKYCCPACGVDVHAQYGDWSFQILENPWKIWCPQCKTKFPTNDFELLYRRGLDENGEYNRELAYQRNAEAVARGEKDALVNELYPEKGATWMVDDGFGWSATYGTYGTMDMEQYTPVALYMYMIWGTSTHNIDNMIESLTNYYLYTGDEDFGRAGAILIDRVADVYPGFDYTKVSLNYHGAHGGGYSGKMLGGIAESGPAETFVRAYDAFYPMFDDPIVIEYLSKKAAEKGLDNPKTNGNLIRENIENGVVRAVLDGVYTGKIYGNFGYHQIPTAVAAVALDTQPETDIAITYLASPMTGTRPTVTDPIFGGEYRTRDEMGGGEMATKYAGEIDRDGFGGEISYAYNRVWAQGFAVAEVLENYSTDILDLYADPKFVNMCDSFIRMTLGNGYTLQVGDGGLAGSGTLETNFTAELASAYEITRDPKIAQIFYYLLGGNLSNASLGYFRNWKELKASILEDIATYGEYQFESENLTGYGLAIARGGKAATKENQYETRYDTWMYYGRNMGSHAHYDMLSLGIDAYGFNFMPDLGGPAAKGNTPNRVEWIDSPLAHNTVMVDEQKQEQVYTGTPLHFESTENVKVIDTECSEAYDQTDIYRRTAVTISVNSDVAYTLDFFRVKGGDQHTYSFHSSSYKHFFTDDIEFVPQVDEKGEYVGTYASPDVPYGKDPRSTDADASDDPLYPSGYTWLDRVNRGTDKTGDGLFTVKFEQTDFNNQVVDSGGLAIKVHALNDWTADSVDIATGYPAPLEGNADVLGYDYLIIQRKGEDLDTLFTTLLEPFKVDDYIFKAEPIAATIKSGTEGADDIVKAVKVTHRNNRVDYVIYATNKNVIYNVTDENVSFDFAGFVGVYTTDYVGNELFKYVNDGTLIGNVTSIGAYTGTVVDFTKEYVMDDYITIKTDQPVEDASIFADHYIYVDNDAKCNGSYRILSAEKKGEYVELYLGNCSIIERYADEFDLDAGFVYTIEDGQSFYIPVSSQEGAVFTGSNRPANGSGNGVTSTDTTAPEDTTEGVTDFEEELARVEQEMLDEMINEGGEKTEDIDALEGLTEATPAPEGETGTEAGDGTPTPDVADANAGGNGVRNILLGGLGVLALLAGLFLILLGKKKDKEDEA